MPRFEWPEGHGERRREEIRKFRREEADTLAKARMAETEREQLGYTRRTRLTEAGSMARERMKETEAEKRHLRQFGPGGYEETGSPAALRLSEAIRARKREENLERYGWGAEELLSPYITRDIEGNVSIPSWAQNLQLRGRAMAETDSEGALKYLREQIGRKGEEEAYISSVENIEAERQKLLGTSRPGGAGGSWTTEPPVSRPAAPREEYPTRLEQMRKTPQEGLGEIESAAGAAGRLLSVPAEYYGRRLSDVGRYLLESQKRSRERLPAYGR